MNQGTIVQCIGAVVDVEFARTEMPKIYDALKMDEIGLTLEVQQQLGDGIVRTIALGSSDGLRRGMTVVNTGNPITVPVGGKTLGRIMDVLGRPIDERGPVNSAKSMSIHRAAPVYEELSGWQTSTQGLREYHELPTKARQYLERLSELIGVAFGVVSTGPERDETILMSDSPLMRWYPGLRGSVPPR